MTDQNLPSDNGSADELIHQQDFGHRLKEAREQLGLSIRDIAEQLNLNAEMLNALELSRINDLPAPTFTQGYIRSYARLLKLPVDEILDAYNCCVPEKANPLVANYGMPIQSEDKKPLFSPVVVLLFLLLLAAVAYYFMNFNLQDDLGANKQFDQVETTAEMPEASTDSIPVVSQEVSQNELSAGQQIDVRKKDDSPVPVNDVVAEPATPVLDRSQRDEQKLTAPQDKIVEAVKQQEAEAPVEGNDVLTITTSSASWAEVQDKNSRRLIFELLDKNQDYQVTGMAPFKVFLGNAPSIQILVNGQEVDIARYIRKNNIAHISVDENAIASFSQRDKIANTSNDEKTQPDASNAVEQFAEEL